ncbi:hypothetical protein [Streptomyces yaizuensis]|uniref:Uncharacterized protein n=1 Tax=Streptomyces yaizuensis TaxID=2989713 RepID=A0ABQ5P2D0_9ACTN|nr:hypothetical protein [Streptomyces sp. YSPA8]GLF96735.1 hypothetical protein SYYSPA8_20580 [Streptomyces sp. YSPA8]
MAARKTTNRKPAPPKCPACDGKGETTETVVVGSRKKQETKHLQIVACLACWGTGLLA